MTNSMTGNELQRATTRRLCLAAVLSNGLGAMDVFGFLALLTPLSVSGSIGPLTLRNGIVALVYMATTLPLGAVWSFRRGEPIREWLLTGGPADERIRRLVLRQPLDFALTSATFWGLAAVLFTALTAPVSTALGASVGVTILLGGLTTSALCYLLAERIVRPVTALALASGAPTRPVTPGVTARLTMAWIVASGVPVLGIVAIAVAQITGKDVNVTLTAAAMLFLAVFALSVGFLAIVMASRSVAESVAAVRAAQSRVEDGDFEARVKIDDGSEVGLLEAGFNKMAEGLAEREQLRDLFGRHVGKEVASAALDGKVALGGELREVGVLFVDIVGSTTIAEERQAADVVGLLNSFFQIVVQVIEDNRGSVNKFEGDAAVCVFGAPMAREDPAGAALCAARALRERLQSELPDVDVGIGVSAGRAVAGNVGAEERFEYTVIGDPVNEAARLSELAKRRPERMLAAGGAVAKAHWSEATRWRVGESVTLRGRKAPTRLATLRGKGEIYAASAGSSS
jgi:adenylate cyclase